MKNIINWKLFSILLAASFCASLMVLPYALALNPVLTESFTSILLVGSMVQGLVMFSIFIFVGLLLAKRTGFGLPFLEGVLNGNKQVKDFKAVVWLSVGAGVFGSVLIILLSFLWPDLSITFLKAEMSVATWKGFLASFYGGVGEEIFARLFLMTLLVWLTTKIKKTANGLPANIGVVVAIILSAIIFGLGHLPITGGVTEITLSVVLRAIVLNGVVGVMLGWLYWKKGLEPAIIAHFSADIVLHVITPVVASFFI